MESDKESEGRIYSFCHGATCVHNGEYRKPSQELIEFETKLLRLAAVRRIPEEVTRSLLILYDAVDAMNFHYGRTRYSFEAAKDIIVLERMMKEHNRRSIRDALRTSLLHPFNPVKVFDVLCRVENVSARTGIPSLLVSGICDMYNGTILTELDKMIVAFEADETKRKNTLLLLACTPLSILFLAWIFLK